MHDQRSFFDGVHPHNGQRMRGPDGPRRSSSPVPVVVSGSATFVARMADDDFTNAPWGQPELVVFVRHHRT